LRCGFALCTLSFEFSKSLTNFSKNLQSILVKTPHQFHNIISLQFLLDSKDFIKHKLVMGKIIFDKF
jgi:hypothetical protein